MRRSLLRALAMGVCLLPAPVSLAQEKYPTKPIDLIVPFVAGASTDSSARVVAQTLEARWGVPVKVINKPGGNTVPAVTEVMAAKPDGTTFLVDNIASSAMLDTVVKNLPFKVTDRTFVAVTSYTPMMFIVHSDSPFKTLKDAGEALKKDAETFTWTSLGGVGAQDMVFRRFAAHLGVDIKRPRAIALKGGQEAVTMTAGGHVTLGTGTYSSIAAPVSANKIRVLAVAGPERWPQLADVPTTKDLGMADVETLFWIGISGPPGLPAHIVAAWDGALKEVLADKAVREKMLNVGVLASYEDAKDMLARVERDQKKTKELYAQ
jgi:tripartite-type tricarboxylate transporter receptor subunit TctC